MLSYTLRANPAYGTSGRNATSRRLAADKEAMMAGRDEERANWRQAGENYLLKSGMSDARVSLRMMGYDAATQFGMSPKTAAGFAVGDGLIQDPSAIQRTLEDSSKNQTEQTNLLQKIAENTAPRGEGVVRSKKSPSTDDPQGNY